MRQVRIDSDRPMNGWEALVTLAIAFGPWILLLALMWLLLAYLPGAVR